MTHEELLAKIDEEVKSNEFACMVMAGAPDWILNSLRAVVELHKPSQENYTGEIGCVGCDVNSEYGTWQEEYPCPTIRAIEKELS
jgi:hypothetical protein